MSSRAIHRMAAAVSCVAVACGESTGPEAPRTWADSAFGSRAIEWVIDDPVGGWTMVPLLDETAVYFERDVMISGGTVVQAAQLLALDRTSGEERWARDIISANNAAIAGDDIAAVWGGLVVQNRGSGADRYIFRYPGRSLSGNVSSDGSRFYMLTHHGRAVALDAASGTIAWDTDLATNIKTTGFGTTLAGGDLIATLKSFTATGTSGDSGIVAVLNKSSGAVRWRVVLDTILGAWASVVDPAVVWDSLVIVGTERHRIAALHAATGAVVWQFDAAYGTPTMRSSGLAVCNGRVIATSGDLGFVALDAASGAMLWRRGDIGAGSLKSLECSHGTIIAMGYGSIHVFDAATGAARARYPVFYEDMLSTDFYIASATRDAQSIYVATSRGFVRLKAP